MLNLLGKIGTFGIISLIVILLLIAAVVVAIIFLVPLKIWFKCWSNGARISMIKLAGLKQRNLDLAQLSDCYILAKKSALPLDLDDLQTHISAGGNITNIVNALLTAQNSNVEISADLVKAIDLSGKNVSDLIKESLNTKTLISEEISVIAKDGIELKVKVSLTLKPILSKMLTASGEDTILARVSEGLVSVVSGLGTHKEILQNPDLISKALMCKDLDKDCCYKVISAEVVNVQFGKNVGAQLRMDEIEVDRKISVLRSEELKNRAIMQEQDMKMKAEQVKLEKIKAEAEIPKVIVKAFEDGKMSLMDYYKMQNIIADTNMRKSWSGQDNKNEDDDED